MRGFSTTGTVSDEKSDIDGCDATHRNEEPATDEGSKKLTTSDVNIPWAKRHQVVRCADGVGRDVDSQCDDDQANSGESCSSSTAVRTRLHPQVDDVDRIPQHVAIRGLGSSGSEYAE